MTIERVQSPNYTAGSQTKAYYGVPRTFTDIAIHWWGDPSKQPKFDGIVAHLTNPASKVSAHYVVGRDSQGRVRVAQLVDEVDTAWHAMKGNPSTIGIEVDPNADDEVYRAVGWLVNQIRSRRGNMPLRPHKHWVNTACPGNLDLGRIDSYSGGNVPAPLPVINKPSVTTRDYTPVSAWVNVTTALNVRSNSSLSASIAGQFTPGSVQITGWKVGDWGTVNGRTSNIWLRTLNGNWANQAGTTASYGGGVAATSGKRTSGTVNVLVDGLNARTDAYLSSPVGGTFRKGTAHFNSVKTGQVVTVNGKTSDQWLLSDGGRWFAAAGTDY